MPKPTKYKIHIEHTSKYDCAAMLVDVTDKEKPQQTTVMAKSMEELMAKLVVAVVLRDKNAGTTEEPEKNGDVPIILTPSRKIVR